MLRQDIGQLCELPFLQGGQVLFLPEYQVAAGDTPAVKHFIGDRPVFFHGVQKGEYIFLVPDPAAS